MILGTDRKCISAHTGLWMAEPRALQATVDAIKGGLVQIKLEPAAAKPEPDDDTAPAMITVTSRMPDTLSSIADQRMVYCAAQRGRTTDGRTNQSR